MIPVITLENKERYYLTPLSAEEVGLARRLCDECVGENLYGEEELCSAVGSEDRAFYLLKSEKGEAVGYIYYYLTEVERIAEYTRLDGELFRTAVQDSEKRVGKLQSVGLRAEYRGIGLAAPMILFALDRLREASADVVFIVCWKPYGTLPLGKALAECRFSFLAEAKGIWYDDTELICPCCKGRCSCDAAVYYKKLNGETSNEA